MRLTIHSLLLEIDDASGDLNVPRGAKGEVQLSTFSLPGAFSKG